MQIRGYSVKASTFIGGAHYKMPKITALLLPFWQISVFCQNIVIILSSKQDLSDKSLNHLLSVYVYSADNNIHFSLVLLH